MDFGSLRDQVSNLTMYDVKAGVRKVQNAVMNYTEMESKVREATNNEPWGASSTLMQEIANGTHSYQLLNEIMPMIYKRFTEKSAEEWRQIYKALQLLEFLIKNGSERVIDDARSHISLLRMLRQFHYIDPNGKDQGINIRNRSQELAKLLGDVDAIRSERKKAKANRNKFGGFEGGMGAGGFTGGHSGGFSGDSGGFGSGGFGSEQTGYGGFSGGVYGDGGGFNGDTSGFRDAGQRTNRFEEYDENEEDGGYSARRRTEPSNPPATRPAPKKKPEPKAPEPDLLGFDDNDVLGAAPTVAAPSTSGATGNQPAGNGLSNLAGNDEDEFDDFQSASPATPATAPQSQFTGIAPPAMGSTSSAQQFAAPQPVSGTQGANLNGLVGLTSVPPTPSTSNMSPLSSQAPSLNMQSPALSSQPLKPTGYHAAQPNYFTSVSTAQPQQTHAKSPSVSSAAKAKPAGSKASGDAFGNLWSSASASAGLKANTPQPKGPNLASMAKEKASAGIWGANAPASTGSGSAQPQQKSGGSAIDDLLG